MARFFRHIALVDPFYNDHYTTIGEGFDLLFLSKWCWLWMAY